MKFASTFTVFISTLAVALAFGGDAETATGGGALIESSADLVIDEADLLLAIAAATAEATTSNENLDPAHRELQSTCDTTAAWHPNYSLGWSGGKCEFITTCNSPSYATNLACCQGAYYSQESNYCISQLANPPTNAPTPTSAPTKLGEGTYYPDYTMPWSTGICINATPIPSGRPTYSSMLACCKAAYGGQVSGACIAALPLKPTSAPTPTAAPTKVGDGTYYPDYSLAWSEGKCISTVPVPSGRPTYTSMLACCKAAYGGQTSGTCIANLPNKPTSAPTPTAAPTKPGDGTYYPDYSLAWSEGLCISTLPVPSGRPTYTSMLACCKAAYGGQTSGTCIANLPNKPTSAPTPTAAPTKPGDGTYYPDYSLAWAAGKCINTLPVPSGRPTYSSMLACCKGAYGGQTSNFCISQLPFPPTSAPTPTPAPTNQLFYPDYTLAWTAGKCISTLPIPSGRPTYSTKASCCANAYAGQSGGICMA